MLSIFLIPARGLAATVTRGVKGVVRTVTYRRLRPVSSRRADQVQQAIIDESAKHQLDPLLVMAVIERESAFRAYKVGSHGEVGLMQVKPTTAKWIAKRSGVHWQGKETLGDPSVNIRLGTSYLAMLRDRFGTPDLYLTAYNVGPSRLQKSLKNRSATQNCYANAVLARYRHFKSRVI